MRKEREIKKQISPENKQKNRKEKKERNKHNPENKQT